MDLPLQPLEVSSAGVDSQDGFYQVVLEALASWFCLGEPYTAAELGVHSCFSGPYVDNSFIMGEFVEVV